MNKNRTPNGNILTEKQLLSKYGAEKFQEFLKLVMNTTSTKLQKAQLYLECLHYYMQQVLLNNNQQLCMHHHIILIIQNLERQEAV